MKQLLTFLILIPFAAFCQNPDSANTKKYSVGISFSPDYCYRTLKPDAESKWIADRRDRTEIPKIGYTTGLNFAWAISKRFSLSTGVLFADKGEKTKKINYAPNPYFPDPTFKNLTFIYHYLYIDIPVKLNYYLLTQRAQFFLTAGISPDIFITEKSTSIMEYTDGSTKKQTSAGWRNDFSKINFTCIAGFGFGYELTKRIHLKAEPTFRCSITSISKTLIKGYYYSAGLNTGIYYRF